MDTLRLGVLGEFRDALTANLRVPPVVDETVLEAHGRGEIDELHLIVVIDGGVLPDEPAPGVAARLIVAGGLIERLDDIVADGGLDDGLQAVAKGDGAPGGLTGQGDAGEVGSEAVVLALVGIGHGVAHASLIVGEVGAAVVGAHARLGNQCPAIGQMEEGREDVAVTILRLHRHGCISRVAFLVRGLGLFPARLGTYLRRDKGGRAVGEVETAEFRDDARAFVLYLTDLLTGNQIAEGDIVVGDLEEHAERAAVLVLEVQRQGVGLVNGRRSLGAAHLIGLVDGACPGIYD